MCPATLLIKSTLQNATNQPLKKNLPMTLEFKPLCFLVVFCLSAAGGLLPRCSVFAAEPPPAGPSPKADTDNVALLLFEADVYFNLGEAGRASELYAKADPSGSCPGDLLAIYQATHGGAEELYNQMQACRRGDMSALASTLGTVFFERKDGSGSPALAYDLYRAAKMANPTGTFQGEQEASELLKMATAAGRMDLEAILKAHGISWDRAAEPYFLWELAEEASAGGRFGGSDAGLVLQLISKGSALPEERAAAIRWAYSNWTSNLPGHFNTDDHTSFRGGKFHLYSAAGLPESWREDHKARCVSLLEQAKQRQIELLGESTLNAAYKLAALKSKNLYLPQEENGALSTAVFFHSQFEQSLRLVEAVFSGVKPKPSKTEGNPMDSFKKWRAAAPLKVPAHLEKGGQKKPDGVCLAFSDPEELRKVLFNCEAFLEQCAALFHKVSSDVALETWQSFLVAHVQQDLGEEARALERWDITKSTISTNEEMVERQRNALPEKKSTQETERRESREQLDGKDPAETIAEARKGDAVSAQWAIDYLLKTSPRDALALYRAATKANPRAQITVESVGGAELEDALKLATDLKPFNLRGFLRAHNVNLDNEDLWDTAKDAALRRRFRGEGDDLTLQLVLRAPRKNPEVHPEPSNYFKAVREAYNLWKHPSGATFDPTGYRCDCDDCEIFNGESKIAQLSSTIERSSTKRKHSPEAVEMAEELDRLKREVWRLKKVASNHIFYRVIESELKGREEDLKALQKGFSSTQKELFAAARQAAAEWISRQSSVNHGDGGIRGDPIHADFNHQGQKEWLKQMEPLIAGYVPSIVYPGVWAQKVVDDLTEKSLEHEDAPAPLEKRKGEASAWAEYRDHAARFLFSISPTLSEEDWKGWLCEVRRMSGGITDTAPELLRGFLIDSLKEKGGAAEEHSVEARRVRNEQQFAEEFKRIESVFKNPRTFDVDLRGVRGATVSKDGRLRVFSRNTETGGTAQNHCTFAQYKAPGFGVEHALLEHPETEADSDFRVYGNVHQIDTVFTKQGETVYLLWTWARTARTRSTESVFAVSWNQGRLKNIPFFQTKKSLLESIQVESSLEQLGEGTKTPEFVRPTEGNGHTLLVPIISDKYQFTGKFFEYVFNGELFVFKAVR